MNSPFAQQNDSQNLTLVIGGTGKTGRRVVQRMTQRGLPVRIGSRSGSPSFDWNQESSWDPSLEGVKSVYITYAPDLAIPGATDTIQAFVDLARKKGVAKLVLLSGRGEAEAQACEKIVLQSGMDATVVRASWFFQNFSEGPFAEMVQAGKITLPVSDVKEPFVDVEDIADVAVAALTEDGHAGQIYEVTGPRLMTFGQVAEELSALLGRQIEFVPVPHDAFLQGLTQSGAPQEAVWLMDYLFTTVLDGRNAKLAGGIERALNRKPTDFAEFARRSLQESAWGEPAIR